MKDQEKIIRLLRISGGGFIAAGLFVFFNIGGMPALLGVEGDVQEILGGALMVVGMLDLAFTPRILEMVNRNNKK